MHVMTFAVPRLLLSRRKDRLIDVSLLNALYRDPTGEEAIRCFRDTVGITYGEARSLEEVLSLISVDLFGFPPNMSEENRWRYREVMPTEPRND